MTPHKSDYFIIIYVFTKKLVEIYRSGAKMYQYQQKMLISSVSAFSVYVQRVGLF